ncbi:Acetylornithine aminotransferase [compost metagenome]
MSSLRERRAGNSFVKEVRGWGVLIGIECEEAVGDIVVAGQKRGILFVSAGPNVIRLLPNLYVSKEEIDEAVSLVATLIEEHVAAKNA